MSLQVSFATSRDTGLRKVCAGPVDRCQFHFSHQDAKICVQESDERMR